MPTPSARRLLAALALLSSAAGCGIQDREAIQAAAEGVPRLARESEGPPGRVSRGNVVLANSVFLGGGTVLSRAREPLPAAVERPDAVRLRILDPVPGRLIAEAIAEASRIPVRIPDVRSAVVGAPGDPLAREAAFFFEGPASGAWNTFSRLYDVDWTYDRGVVVLQPLVTRTYPLPIQPALRPVASAGQGEGALQPATEDSAAILADIATTLGQIVVAPARFSVNEAESSVVVTASPEVQAVVADAIRRTAELRSRPLAVRVDVLTIETSDTDTLATDLSFLFSDILANSAVSYTSLAGGGAVGGILRGGAAPGATGVQSLITALNRAGLSTRDEGETIYTQSGVASVTRRTLEVFYVSGSTSNIVNQTVQTSQQLEQLEVGFRLSLRPSLQPGGRVVVAFDLSTDSLVSLEDVRDDNGRLVQQIPRVERQQRARFVPMAAGETLVVGAYTLAQGARLDAGPVTSRAWFLGGQRTTETGRTVSVILLTPQVLTPAQPPFDAGQGVAGRRLVEAPVPRTGLP
jgi:hypothetical protein